MSKIKSITIIQYNTDCGSRQLENVKNNKYIKNEQVNKEKICNLTNIQN